MPNSVVAKNTPGGALVGGSPANVIVRQQRRDLNQQQRRQLVIDILEGNDRALAVQGYRLQRDRCDGSWVGRLSNGKIDALVIVFDKGIPSVYVQSDRIIFVGLRSMLKNTLPRNWTMFDLEKKLVQGRRDMAADILRQLFQKYGVIFDPHLWRFGCRLGEEEFFGVGPL
jgi:hypothetical protein